MGGGADGGLAALLRRKDRLLIRYERRADIHEAFLSLGCSIICFKRLNSIVLEVLRD